MLGPQKSKTGAGVTLAFKKMGVGSHPTGSQEEYLVNSSWCFSLTQGNQPLKRLLDAKNEGLPQEISVYLTATPSEQNEEAILTVARNFTFLCPLPHGAGKMPENNLRCTGRKLMQLDINTLVNYEICCVGAVEAQKMVPLTNTLLDFNSCSLYIFQVFYTFFPGLNWKSTTCHTWAPRHPPGSFLVPTKWF